jgi:hypothetical protein
LASLFAAVIVADVLPLPELGADIVAAFLLMAIYSQLAPLVSYRWFDVLLLLIPLVRLWWSAKVMWWISSLPVRYRQRVPTKPLRVHAHILVKHRAHRGEVGRSASDVTIGLGVTGPAGWRAGLLAGG